MSEQLLIGTRKGSFCAEKVAGGWAPRLIGHVGVGVNFIAKDPASGTLWAALGHGHWGAKLSRSDDGGTSWKDAAQIKFPKGARYYAPPMPSDEEEEHTPGPVMLKDASVLKLWTIAFGKPGSIYIGTIPGGLFVSEDSGESFHLNLPLWNHESRGGDLFGKDGTGTTHWFGTPASEGEFAPGIHSILVNPKDPNHLYVGISTAGVLESRDGGKTWQGRNKGLQNDYLPDPNAEWGHDPHAVALSLGQPQHVWQQNHCGVFYSDDGAASWRRVNDLNSGVNFGFPIAVSETNGATAWVVPGKADQQRTTIEGALFVARTDDGGKTWTQHRKGLPQHNAYDVVYRHALANRGKYLAFGSTTGNLYLSEDHGESWVTVANNLPPIYSVQFA